MRSHYLKLALTAALLGSALAHAEDAKEEPKKGAISGLPDDVELNLTFSAGWGFFGFANSLYCEFARRGAAGPVGQLDGGIRQGWLRRQVQAVERQRDLRCPHRRRRAHYNAPPPWSAARRRRSSSKTRMSAGAPAPVSVSAKTRSISRPGARSTRSGHGMLIWDGGLRGWLARRLLEQCAQGLRIRGRGQRECRSHQDQGFYLDRDELPENDSDSKTYGLNFEYSWNEDNTLGART
jgi:hypothetical protein